MISKFLKDNHQPKYRLKQFNQAFYQELIEDFDKLIAFPKKLRQDLANHLDFSTLKPIKQLISQDKETIKVVLERDNGTKIETVLMRHQDQRNTVCLSSMVGCPVGCKFCATGKMGYMGDLSSREIVDQFLYFQRLLKKEGQKITNIVFMGMGEPMLNFENVLKACDIFCDPDKLGLSQRRITLSTSGYIPQIQQLIDKKFKGRLAISLHAPNQQLRAKLMPVAKLYSLDKLMHTLDQYVKITNKRISYEYILIENVTDTKKAADELIKLLRNRLAHVNLIPYNPVPGEDFKRPSKNRIFTFANQLEKAGIKHTIRITMGDDIAAACGQLATKL